MNEPENLPPAKVSPEGGKGTIGDRGLVPALDSFGPDLGSKDVDQNEVSLKEVGRKEVAGRGTGPSLLTHRFTWQKKRRFIKFARLYWPNVTQICALSGISLWTYRRHYKLDALFALKVQEAADAVTDRIEGVMAEEAVKPKSFLDRIAYLRAHRPQLYNPAKVIRIEGVKLGADEATARLQAAEGAIDAQIVEEYQRRKGKPQQLPAGGGGTTGGEDKAGGVDK